MHTARDTAIWTVRGERSAWPLSLTITQPQKNLETVTTSVIKSASPQPIPTKQRNLILQTVL